MKKKNPIPKRPLLIQLFIEPNRPLLGFLARFVGTYLVLILLYNIYLRYTEYTHTLDWVTYSVSEFSFYLAKSLGVADCTFSCFIEGCYVGREGKLIHVVEGCNGFKLAIAYAAFIVGYSGFNFRTLIQVIIGLAIIQGFNVLRIGILIVLRDLGGDVYFYFVKYLFGSIIYAAIITLWSLQPYFNRINPNQG
jgi:exosortase family protein XrtF